MRVFLACCLFSCAAAWAFDFPKDMQDGVPVRVESGFFSTRFTQGANDIPLRQGSMREVLSRYPEARTDVTASKIWLYPGYATSLVGGFLIGYFGTQALLGEGFNAPGFYMGVGWAGLGLLFSSISEGTLTRAVEKYNALLPEDAGIEWKVTPERRGLALHLRF
jgi:hypothetical protein